MFEKNFSHSRQTITFPPICMRNKNARKHVIVEVATFPGIPKNKFLNILTNIRIKYSHVTFPRIILIHETNSF